MKRAKKQIIGIAGTAMLGAAGSSALGAIGGSAALSGQKGIANATSFLGTTGTMTGLGMMLRAMPAGKKRKR